MDFIPKLSGNYSLDKKEAPPASAPEPDKGPESGVSPESNANLRTSWDNEADEAKVTFRLKSAAGAGLAMLILYGLIAALSGGPHPTESSYARFEGAEQFDQDDRSVETARAKVGFIQRLFCGGLRRSSFCD